ncbi:MAG: heat-inducible transcriptional repressor HrcA [Jaaginema sp. PMC 1079.18]|nr:heat-inducible transcriptional repressor HrcA [Jaaginema sp. PMC 1080.18]MEC4849529.1 heat-inducible transcriptional repressor HrcA [Jaaginema sp. PMC 1079.18]MEC4865721.1 heat-inducible transcriptional repressor HrcA [Jaaginema sp. PMC 1078.18]
MSEAHKLNERQQDILKATVHHYVATAEPVGSKTLAQEYNFKVSSATIRNTMGRLEKAGLLYQPYTSAGRIPSDSGYRIYVDRLMIPNEVGARQIEQVYTTQLDGISYSFESFFQSAAQLLATISGQIALITLPQNIHNILHHLQLIQVNATQLMLIVVTDTYQTQSVLMELPPVLEATGHQQLIGDELQLLSNFLNHKLQGKSLSTLTQLDWTELDRDFASYTNFLKKLLNELTRRAQLPASTPILIRGISEVLRQPEFCQLQQVQMLLHLLEEGQEQLLPIVFDLPEFDSTQKRVTVRIGTENQLEPLNTCALITANYHRHDIPVGSVGLIGPTRMIYENAIAMVEAAADYISAALS